MKLNKKELDRIVAFVKAVKELPGNEEFIANLREVLEMNYSVAQMPLKSEKIDAIEKYLGLDYSLDDSIPIIDYSFVIDNRKHLEDAIGYKIYDEYINGIDSVPAVLELDLKYEDLIAVSNELYVLGNSVFHRSITEIAAL